MKVALAWIALSVCLGAVGQLLLKVTAAALGTHAFGREPLAETLLRLARLPALWIGVALYVISMVLWIRALTTAPLGLAYPMVASGYVLVLALSWLFLGEPVTARQVAGIVAVGIGVVLLAGAR